VSGAEKTTIGSILDREQRRERNLEAVRKMAKIPRTPADLSIASQYKLQGTIDQQGFLARERDWLTQTLAK
jgi:endonuclease III